MKWWGRIDDGPGRAEELAWCDAAQRVVDEATSGTAIGIPAHARRTEILARIKAVRAKWARADRTSNPSSTKHAIPAKACSLGRALDLVVELDGRRTRIPLRGSLLLAPVDAFSRRASTGRLYVVRGKLADTRPPQGAEKGTEAFRRWHKRAADLVGYVDTPPPAGKLIGRAVRIGYASDKWTTPGKHVEYEHDFATPGPLVYSTGEERPRALVLVGGRFTVTSRGIVD